MFKLKILTWFICSFILSPNFIVPVGQEWRELSSLRKASFPVKLLDKKKKKLEPKICSRWIDEYSKVKYPFHDFHAFCNTHRITNLPILPNFRLPDSYFSSVELTPFLSGNICFGEKERESLYAIQGWTPCSLFLVFGQYTCPPMNSTEFLYRKEFMARKYSPDILVKEALTHFFLGRNQEQEANMLDVL